MYIEASAPRRPGQKAHLWTPVIVGSGCVSFWYNMYGSGMGTLRVYSATAASSSTNLGQPLWSLSGNQGNLWLKTQVKLPARAGNRVSMRGLVLWVGYRWVGGCCKLCFPC